MDDREGLPRQKFGESHEYRGHILGKLSVLGFI